MVKAQNEASNAPKSGSFNDEGVSYSVSNFEGSKYPHFGSGPEYSRMDMTIGGQDNLPRKRVEEEKKERPFHTLTNEVARAR